LIEKLAEVELVFPEVRAEQLAEIERVIHLPGRKTGTNVFPLIPATI